MKPTTHFRCGLYARVSTDMQASQPDGSLDLQMNRMRAELKHRNSKPGADKAYEITKEYVEDGKSGKTLDRPALNKLKADIIAGDINVVVFVKIDRLSRSLIDFFHLITFFEEHGVLAMCLDDEFDTSTPTGRAILKLLLVFAELEREQTAERTKGAMKQRAIQGLHNGGRIWGYSLDPEKKGHLVVDPDAARVIRLIFDKYLELGSTDEVLKYLHAHGITSPEYTSRRGLSQGGRPIHKQTLINILRNPRYIGKVPHGDDLYEGRHEAIVSEETFKGVQRRLDNYAQLRRPRKTKAAAAPHYYILRGLIRCGACGSMMTPKPGKGYPYYVCTRVTNSASTRCKTPHLPAKAIEDHVLSRLRQIALDPDEVKKLLSEAAGREDEDITEARASLERLQKIIGEKKKTLFPWQSKLLEAGPNGMQEAWYQPVAQMQAELNAHVAAAEDLNDKIRSAEVAKESEDIVVEAYQKLGSLLAVNDAEALSHVVPLIIEVISWLPTPDPETPEKYIGGTYKMALFDNPLFPKDKDGNVLTADDLSSSQGQGWLPR